jgi:uncharacterized repeat protein (TIGR02543 family)
MIQRSIQLLTDLHNALFYIGGHVGLAPADATYPLVTYSIVGSTDSPSKSFTSEGNVFTVQFSYFDDGSFLGCLNLAAQVEDILEGLGDVLDVDKGNLLMVANTQKSKLFQCIDTRKIEILVDKPAPPPPPLTYTLTYNGNEGIGSAPVDPESPYEADSVVTVLDDTGLARPGYTFTAWNTASDGSGLDLEPGDIFTITEDTTLYAKWAVVVPVSYLWTGTESSVMTDPLNYTPNGVPTAIDSLVIDDTLATAPQTGAIACATLNVYNNNFLVEEVAIGASCEIDCPAITFWDLGTANYNTGFIFSATFVGLARNYGYIGIATMIPVFRDDAWIYPENSGNINVANCYWDSALDYTLGGSVNTVNYLGFIED